MIWFVIWFDFKSYFQQWFLMILNHLFWWFEILILNHFFGDFCHLCQLLWALIFTFLLMSQSGSASNAAASRPNALNAARFFREKGVQGCQGNVNYFTPYYRFLHSVVFIHIYFIGTGNLLHGFYQGLPWIWVCQ